jgi:cellulose synthase operon protein YhjQ
MGNEKQNDAKLTGETAVPEDVATLYSWANLHGAKYRDFSATRQEARSQARNRAHLEQLEKEAAKESPEAVEAPVLAQDSVAAQPDTLTPIASAPAAPVPVAIASPATTTPAARTAWEELIAPQPAAQATEPVHILETPLTETRHAESEAIPARPYLDQSQEHDHLDRADLAASPFATAPVARAAATPWPSQEKSDSRWFALNSILNQSDRSAEARPSRPRETNVPILAVFSLAGGVGKTGIVATLGRALAARGEKVLMVDTNSYGLLPLYYGAKDARPGVVRTFSGDTTHAAIQLLSLDTDRYSDRPSLASNSIADDVVRSSQGTDRVLVDLATGSSTLTRQILRLAPQVLVPLVPDISSLASLQAVESFFARQSGADGRPIEPLYILNRFDASLPLHRDLREVLRQRLGDRLLPFTLRRTASLSEALAEGMTVVDYSPGALIVEDYAALSSWLRNLSAPAGSVFRGHRWSEQ